MIIAIDFDGTCVTHDYPEIGKDIGAIPILKALVKNGDKLILWTMRSGETLDAAVKWFSDNGIELWGVNKNPEQTWSDSPKAYAHLYIDDAALGCPIIMDFKVSERPFVDWNRVKEFMFGKVVIGNPDAKVRIE